MLRITGPALRGRHPRSIGTVTTRSYEAEMLSLLGLKQLVLSRNTYIYQLDDASSSEPDQRSKSFCWFGDSRHRVLTLVYGRSAALHWHTCPGCVAVFSIPVLILVQSSARRPLVSSFHHHNRALRRCIQIPSLELLSANQISNVQLEHKL
jgi:hypothetical protein